MRRSSRVHVLAVALLASLIGCAQPAAPVASTPGVSDPVTALTPALGLQASYYSAPDFSGPRVNQTDAQLSFDWGRLPAVPGLQPGTLSARWSGTLSAPKDGSYTLHVVADGTARVFVDDQPVVTQGHSVTLSLSSQRPVALRAEFVQAGPGASFGLEWESADAGVSRQVIPLVAYRHAVSGVQAQNVSTGGVPRGQNLLTNGNFEGGNAGWPGTSVPVTPGADGTGQAIGLTNFGYLQQNLPSQSIEVGASYTFSAAAKSSTASACTVGLASYDANGTVTRTLIPFSGAWGGGWQRASTTATLPYGSTFMAVYLGGNADTCAFDDVTLSVPATVIPDPAASSWVVNGSFESGAVGSVPQPWGAGTLVAPGQVNGQAFSNARWSWTQQNLAPATVAAFTSGQPYTLSAAARAVSGGACTVLFQGGDDTSVLFSTILDFRSSAWTNSSIAGTLPAGVRWAAVILATTDPECQFDDVTVGSPAVVTPLPTPVDDLIIDPSFLRPAVFLGGEVYLASTNLESPDLTYAWDFGDGSSATGGAVAHQYVRPGFYTARMTVTNGAQQTKSSTAQIAVMPDIHDMPSARAVVLGRPVTFDVGYPVSGLTYAWDFGDGQAGTGAQVQHLYTKRGFQDVTLTIYDDRAALPSSGTVGPSLSLAVTDPEGRPVLEERETRINNIVPLPTAVVDGTATGPLNISLSAVYSKGATALTYTWDFSDGTVLTGPNVSRAYSQNGRYPITLTVTDEYGQTDSAHQVVVLGTRANDAQIYSMNVNLGTGAQAGLSAQGLAGADAQVQKALTDARRRAGKAVIYLKGVQSGETGGPRLPAGTSAQSIKAQADSDIDQLLFPYPFVIPTNPAAITGIFNSQGYLGTGQFDQASASMSLNGVRVPPGQGWTTTCSGRDCSSATLDRSFFPASPAGLRTGINAQTFNFQTVESTGTISPPTPRVLSAPRSFTTDLPVFSGLRVPKIALNIVPDTQLADVTVKRYAYDNAGRREFFAQVNVPESAITSGGFAPFVIPMYAVDQNGQLMTGLNGAFDAKFSDPRLYSGTREGTMVGGVTEMVVYVPVSTFTDGTTKFDLNSVLVGPAGCGQDNNFAFGGFSESGCQTITATSDVPIFPGAGVASPSGLRALSANGVPSQYEIQNYPYLVLQEVSDNFNRFLFGTVGQRQYIEALHAYDGSNAALLVSLLPFVGDSADLLTQAYLSKFDKGGDPVIVTLAAIGLSVDLATGAGGEPVTVVKSVYKISKKATGFLADDIRTTVKSIIDGKLKPTAAIKVVLGQYGTFAKIYLKDGSSGLVLADRLANGLTSLPTCPTIGTLSLTAQSCSKLGVLQAVVRLSEKLFAVGAPRIEVFKSFINICCSKTLGGGGYIRGAEKLLEKLGKASIPQDITGVLSEARAGALLRDAGKVVEFPGENTFRLLNGGTSAPDLVLRDAAGNITHLIEVKTGAVLSKEKEAILKDMIQVLNGQNPVVKIRPGFIALVKALSKTQLDLYRRAGVDVFDKAGNIIN